MKFYNFFIAIVVSFSLCGQARAQPVGSIISYQGKLTNTDGTPVANGTHTVTFKIYENGVAKFNQGMPVATLGGVFSVFLGTGALTFDTAKVYLMGVTYNGIETKHAIASVPVAQMAKLVPDGSITSPKLKPTAGRVEFRGVFSPTTTGETLPGATATITVEKPSSLLIVGDTTIALDTAIPGVPAGSKIRVSVKVDDGTPADIYADIETDKGNIVPTVQCGTLTAMVDLEPGTHTIELQGRLVWGSATVYQAHCFYVVIAR